MEIIIRMILLFLAICGMIAINIHLSEIMQIDVETNIAWLIVSMISGGFVGWFGASRLFGDLMK